ncbi:amidohydrolase [Polaromonas sp. P1-6]|nr:amidohydrolase [Polaromonas sp. P1-6]
MYVINFHSHVIEPALLDACFPHSVQTGFGARPSPKLDDPSGKGAVYAKMADPAAHIAYMDTYGIDATVVSLSTVLQNSAWADAAQDRSINRQVNELIAKWVGETPKRFIGSFTLPLQDMNASLEEFDHGVNVLGLRVINLPSNAGGKYLGDACFDPLWAAMERAGVTAFLHPSGISDPWFQEYRMWNSIGQSIEEVKAMTSLIYGGVMDRFPALKIVVAHGGGYFPHYMGRLDRNVTNYPDSARNIRGLPSDYLRRFYYDTCVYDPQVIDSLIERVGADRLILGSDFPVGEPDPVAFLRRCASLRDEDLPAIAGGTAARLLGLPVPGAAK